MFHKIDGIFEEYMSKNYFSGGVCSISIDGKNVFNKAFGVTNRVDKQPCTLDTTFDLASVTKIVTTTIILKMISENKLALTSKLANLLPEVSRNEALANLTIKQLLTHSSGLIAWHPFYSHTINDFFRILNNMDVKHQTTNEVVYSDLNFMLLGEIIKHHYQSRLQSVIRTELEPLQLPTLTYNPGSIANIAATEFGNRIEQQMCKERNIHFNDWRDNHVPIKGEVNDGNAYYFFKGEAGHAGLFSNVSDIVAIGELYLKGGVHKNKRLISKSLIDESLMVHVANRGLGWETSSIYPEGFGHTGFTGTALWVAPKRNLVVGLLTNRLNVDSPKNINLFRQAVFQEIFKQITNE